MLLRLHVLLQGSLYAVLQLRQIPRRIQRLIIFFRLPQLLRDLPQDYQNYIEQVYPGRFLVLGDEGRAVRQFQENVRKIAAQDPAIPTVEADGVFGPATQRAVLALQRQLGIDQSGAVGPVLWSYIVTQGLGYGIF